MSLVAAFSPLGAFLCLLIVLLCFLLYRLLYAPYQVHKRCGIRGPRPTPFWGSYWDIKRMGERDFLQDCHDKYGSVYGFYLGSKFKIAVTDPDMLKEIMVKKFDSFADRGSFSAISSLMAEANGYPRGLLGATGDTWKACRRTLSPAFSSLKLKQMLPLIKRSTDTLVQKFGEVAELQQSVDVNKLHQKFSMEVQLAVSFGRYIEVQNGEANAVLDAATEVVHFLQEGKSFGIPEISLVLSHFPVIYPLLRQMSANIKGVQAFGFLTQSSAELVEEKRKQDTRPQVKDLLDLMLETKLENRDKTGDETISTELVVSYASMFLMAGYETVVNLLSFTCYLLALHHDVQEKLQAEIDQHFEIKQDGSLYDAIKNMQYLDKVIQESLRVFSPTSTTLILSRNCGATTEINGIIIPKGTEIVVPMFLLHNNSEYWPEPNKFDPERFTAEERAKRPQLAHIPFGWGPRSCIGMNLALLEAKLALIEILRHYTLLRSPDTEVIETPKRCVAQQENVPLTSPQVPPEIIYGASDTPKNGIVLKIMPRSDMSSE